MPILPDTNVLLHAAFDSLSVARYALDKAVEMTQPVIIERNVRDEAFAVLRARSKKLELQFDLSPTLSQFLNRAGFEAREAAPSDWEALPVNRQDRHVARAARHYGARLVTSDVKLVVQCRGCGLDAVLPWSLITELDPTRPYDREHLRISTLSLNEGSIFLRFQPGGWQRVPGINRVLEITHLGVLSFDVGPQEWLLQSIAGNEARLPFNLGTEGAVTICLNYKTAAGSQRMSIGLQTLKFGEVEAHRTWNGWQAPLRVPAFSQLGHGVYRHVVVSPQRVKRDTWTALASIPDGAPDPFSANVLETILSQINLKCLRWWKRKSEGWHQWYPGLYGPLR